jgi:glutathione S-transferase
MAITLYTSWFSTFARKVALGLELKGLAYEAVDGLRRDYRPRLLELNPRAEVPVLVDGDVTVINSPDILQFLDLRYPSVPLYPVDLKDRVEARALERLADQRFDPLVVCSSFWHWAERHDEPPPGLLAAAQKDLEVVLTRLERTLESRRQPWPFDAPGVVECAWFPNAAALKAFGFIVDEARFPATARWMEAMRAHPVFTADRRRTAEFLKHLATSNHERRKLFWSGDRLEWMLSHGFHQWIANEVDSGRTSFAP